MILVVSGPRRVVSAFAAVCGGMRSEGLLRRRILRFPHPLRTLLVVFLAACAAGCMEWDYGPTEEFSSAGRGLFVVCEGNFQYGNASLSYYDPAKRTVENEVFRRSNGFRLGDVAQSMTVHDGVGWVVVNNSHVIFAIDPDTFREVGRITDLTSPRHIHFLSDRKAYVTQLWDNRIFVVDPARYAITGHIECPDMTMESGSTERMVQLGRYVYVSCWSYQNRILKVDSETDEVIGELVVGIQPSGLVADRNGRLWVLTDGGYEGSPYGHEAPLLCRIDPEAFVVERIFRFDEGDSPSGLCIDGAGERLYWLDGDVWSMPVDAVALPEIPFLADAGTEYYGLTVDPVSGEVYVADAIDFQQPGIVYRFSPGGERIDSFYVGVTPGSFCWK